MKKIDSYFEEIKDAAIKGQLIFFVGAGVSALSGYPGWSSLVQEFEKGIDKKRVEIRKSHINEFPECPFQGYSTDEFIKIPQKYYNVKGKSKYNEILNDFFYDDYDYNVIHELMLDLNPAHFITTNYDKLIEKASMAKHKNYSSISSDNGVAKASSSNYILKVHGEFSDVIDGKNIVLKEDDYINYDSNYPLINNLVKSLVATHTVVFIGYGLNDYNINQMLNWVKRIQKNDFNHYFVYVNHTSLIASEKKYYEKRGMNIIDISKLIESDQYEYRKRYYYFIDRLINEGKWSKVKDLRTSLVFIDYKLNQLSKLNYLRKADFKIVFDNDYEIYPSGRLFKLKSCKFDYFQEYFNYKLSDMLNLEMNRFIKSIDAKLKSLGILTILEWNSDKDDIKKTLLSAPKYESNNLLVENKYDRIESFLNKSNFNLEEKLERAYYLASLGEWEHAYSSYSDIIGESYQQENWIINYISKINRFFMARLIYTLNSQLSSTFSFIVLGRKYKVFSDDFLKIVEKESTFNLPKVIFDGMPNRFKVEYSFLKWLSDEVVLSTETSEISKLFVLCSKRVRTNSFYIGNDHDYNKLVTRMHDNILFCSDNFVWIYPFTEFKSLTQMSLAPLFDSIRKEQSNGNKATFFGVEVKKEEYYIDYYEYIYMVKNYNLKDLKENLKDVNLHEVKFDNSDAIEEFSIRTLKQFTKETKSGTESIMVIRYLLLHEEIKNILYLCSNFKFSEPNLLYLAEFILNIAYERDLNIGDRLYYLHKLLINNQYSTKMINLIDDFIWGKFILRANEDYEELTNRSNIYQLLTSAVLHLNSNSKHKKLSQELLKSISDNFTQKQINFMFANIERLSLDAQIRLLELKCDYSLSDIITVLDLGILDYLPNYEDKILGNTDAIAKQIHENKKANIRTIPEPTIRYTGILFLAGCIENLKVEKYLGICDEFDMLVKPEKFDFDNKLDWSWFKYYTPKVLDEIFSNSILNAKLKPLLKRKINEEANDFFVKLYFKYF